MNPIISFQSPIIRISLAPDSRGYVLFSLHKQDPNRTDLFSPLTSSDVLTCEYLVDLITVSAKAAKWIGKNCEEITVDGRHLYYRFKGD